MWFFWVFLSVPIAVILTIVFQDRHKLEIDDLRQVEDQANKEENNELKKVKKQLKVVETINIKPLNNKVNGKK